MPLGPGKYDPLCTIIREATRSDAVMLAVIGPEGAGFSVQADLNVDGNKLADILETVAREIRRSYNKETRGMQ